MIAMRGTDLAELYTLPGMYDRSYGGVPEELIESVKGAYQASYRNRKEEHLTQTLIKGSLTSLF